MKNICFIEAKSPGAHIFSRTPFPRLGTILLATILRDRGYNTRVFIEDLAEPEWDAVDSSDLVCISSITSTAPRAYQIAKRVRALGIPVVMGGPHPTFLPEEALEYADYVIRGEGEETITELVDHLTKGLPLDSIKGLSFKNRHGNIIHNPNREFVQDLDAAPIPDFSLVHKWEDTRVIPIATSRGCPFACRFCSVIQMFGRKYRFKSIARVIDEIKAVALGKKVHVFFVDDNFAADKKRTKALLRSLIEHDIHIEWSAQMRTDIAKDPELVRLMAKTGCFSVFIGFESINPRTLALYNKNQDVEDNTKCIKMLKEHSINIHGMFVVGSDTDDIHTIRSTAEYAKRLGIDSIQFMMLTPLPGTPVFKELKEQGRIIHTDWSKYDAHHAVFEPKLMTPFELHIETLKAMAKFYSWPSILRNFLRRDFFYGFIGIYGKRSVKKSLARAKGYLEHLKGIIIDRLDSQTERLRGYLIPRKEMKDIVLNVSSLGKTESRFFSTFFKKLDRNLIINSNHPSISTNALTLVPIVQGNNPYIPEEYRRHGNVRVVNLKTHSLYNACVNIGLLMDVNLRKIRKAYEKALKEIGGNAFECNSILIMLAATQGNLTL